VEAAIAQHLEQGLGLGRGAGEAVEDEAGGLDVVGLQPLPDDGDGHLVADQTAGLHDRADLATELGAGRHRGPEHVPGAQVDDVVGIDDAGALGALAGPLAPEDHQAQRPIGHMVAGVGHGYFKNPS
jgi:hypothetical protein